MEGLARLPNTGSAENPRVFLFSSVSYFAEKVKYTPSLETAGALCYNGAKAEKEKGGFAMKRLVIDRQAVVNNLKTIREKAGKAKIYAVLTGDACGAGLLEMAGLLHQHGVTRFAVSEPGDAAKLRKAGLVEEEILMLRSTVNRQELEQLLDLNVICSIGSSEAGMALNSLAESRSTVAEAHIQVDSGMGYGGFVISEPDKILAAFQNLQNVAISGIYTQFQSSSTNEKSINAQLDAFTQVVRQVHRAGFETGTVHAAGSFSTLRYDFARFDAVRVGSALLGRCKRTKNDGLQRVGYCEATIEEIRWLPAGHTVGYESPVKIKKPTRVATLAVGYQNGLSVSRPRKKGLLARLFPPKNDDLAVRVGNQRAKIIGRVGAIETLIDVTSLKCAGGDWVQIELDPMYAQDMPKEYR